MKKYFIFTGKFTLIHVITYFIAGAFAYPLLTKQFYVGDNPIFSAFMVTQNDPELWVNVTKWILPGQILRGILMASVLYLFFEELNSWSYLKRFFSITSIYLVFGLWASSAAAPGTIDGLIYMRPEISLYSHLMVQPEIVGQGILLGGIIARWMKTKNLKI